MKSRYYLDCVEDVAQKEEKILFQGLNSESFQVKGMKPIRGFGVFIKNSDQNIFGGAKGASYYGCLYVDMLWIDKSLRYLGFGRKIMQAVEKIGKDRNCIFAAVNTMDWEALPFYQKLGYEIEFIREGYEKDSKMYMLRKKL